MVGSLFDDLDDLPEGTVERLVGVSLGRGAKTGLPGRDTEKQIKIRLPERPKPAKKGLRYFEPRIKNTGEWSNMPVEVTIELPAYLVAGLEALGADKTLDEHIRVAVREYFEKRGIRWWYPRFLMSALYDVQVAKDRFTRKFG